MAFEWKDREKERERFLPPKSIGVVLVDGVRLCTYARGNTLTYLLTTREEVDQDVRPGQADRGGGVCGDATVDGRVPRMHIGAKVGNTVKTV